MTQDNRRNFLKTACVASAGTLFGTQTLLAKEKTTPPVKEPKSSITRETIAEADKLTGVPHTDSERDMMIGSIEHRLQWTKQIRDLGIKNDYAAPPTVLQI